ncbi:MAG TPA: OpgC domain-containing protein [Steroidobacteraceae bacterium]|nr:OpgC domain-containing protein [Steroidobacteraceae bacterium]
MARDARIDIVRGAGVLMIALDHLAGTIDRIAPAGFTVPFITWSRIGWSSAAEFFVFFSGYLIGLVYSSTLEARGPAMLQARAIHRSWQIYAANVLTALVVLLLLYATPIGSTQLVDSANFSRLLAGDGSGWVSFLTLQQAPMFFEILQLYVLLILIAPVVLLIARANVLVALAGSIAVWLAVQVNPGITISGWTFNPFAWQLVFVLGMLFSTTRAFEKIEAAVPRATLLVSCAAFICVAGLIKVIDKGGIALPLLGQIDVPGIDKQTLGPLRLTHFMLSVVLIMQLLPRSGRHLASLPARSVAGIGQYSLECFCMSTILVYTCSGLLVSTASVTTASVLVSGIVLVLLLCLFAAFMAWIRNEPWRGDRVRKQTRDEPAARTDATGAVADTREGFTPGRLTVGAAD